jgi:hypothetical protein
MDLVKDEVNSGEFPPPIIDASTETNRRILHRVATTMLERGDSDIKLIVQCRDGQWEVLMRLGSVECRVAVRASYGEAMDAANLLKVSPQTPVLFREKEL